MGWIYVVGMPGISAKSTLLGAGHSAIAMAFGLELERNWCFFPTVRHLLLTLLTLGILAGLGERMLSQVGWHVNEVVMSEDCCGGHDAPAPDDDHHGPNCPPEPHHHHKGVCCGTVLVVEDPECCRLSVRPGTSRVAWSHPDEAAPDGPFFEMDKPPLI